MSDKNPLYMVYKQRLRNKICLFEKIFFNFNKYFNNYTYYLNFNNFYEYNLNDNEIKKAESLIKNNNFENFKEILSEIIEVNYNKKHKKIKKLKSHELNMSVLNDIKKLEIIDEKHIFAYSEDSVKLLFVNEDYELSILENTEINFEFEIESATVSQKNNRIYVCLSDRKIINIFNYDIVNGIMEQNNKEIKYENNNDENHFIKCIELENCHLAVAESDKRISLWNLDKYTNVGIIDINYDISNILSINSDYFISSQPTDKSIIFYNIKDLKQKKIKNIESSDNTYSLTSNKNYILVCGDDGIYILSVKYQELIQYFGIFEDNPSDGCIKIDENNQIYYLDNFNPNLSINCLEIYEFKEDSIIKNKDYVYDFDTEGDDKNMNIYISERNEIIFITNGNIVLCDKNEEKAEEDDDDSS